MKKEDYTLDLLNSWNQNTMGGHLGMEFTEIGPDYLCGKMPVDHRTHQPMGLLHGGASAALAETLGSVAGLMQVDSDKQACVGLEINANHLKSVRQGYVFGKATAVHIGKKTQVWDIRITTENGSLVCVSRLTLAVLDRANK
ncbi:MAG: 1,4-dihydroxy-2-naphthoyl-CoA hydrolase in menaquinone biosynthesis [uncultured Adhaeribacter sp.]|uniref:1,4-dihydroxy-2-naphthoyl-CoA hydrolase in menaquinone biosynthesis n=1 Tax=uncultured Adhaeribacter sp. TaxID=448109 RepID=A0A6J4K0U6_9BACT|nr:MAG: 1,4-dihydroxy-2-naphthoyl-CoA hydrolase in menaquinone biosynthesis [uncultured Adhaeribacter sp.]